MNKLLSQLRRQFPSLTFTASDSFYWSPKKQTIHYVTANLDEPVNSWSLLHELGHALLEHQTYKSDFDLLAIEVAAWEQAKSLGQNYDITIDSNHIQDCLDTYRDWLYLRSSCPSCGSCSLQIDTHTYSCFNCNESWTVSRSRKCRSYRKKQTTPALLAI